MGEVVNNFILLKMLDNLQNSINVLKESNDKLNERVDKLENRVRDDEYYKIVNKEIK